MSAAKLLCQPGRQGLSFETRGGLYEITIDLRGTIVRTVNCQQVASFESNSRTAKRLEELFGRYKEALEQLNQLASKEDRTEFNQAYWNIRSTLKGD